MFKIFKDMNYMIKENIHYQVFSLEWFKRNQRILLWFINGPFRRLVRYVLQIDDNRILYDIYPNHYKILTGEHIKKKHNKQIVEKRIQAIFYTRNIFSIRLYYALKPIWWIMHFWDWIFADRFISSLSFGFNTLTTYPEVHPETNSVDGQASCKSGNFSDAHSGAGVLEGNDDGANVGCTGTYVLSQYTIVRSFLHFYTAALGSSAEISEAIISLYPTVYSDGGSGTGSVIVQSTVVSNSSIVSSDFVNIGNTVGSSILQNATVNVYNNFTLNSTGIGWISKTGTSKFGIREKKDIDNEFLSAFRIFNSAETGGSTSGPKLVVTYTSTSVKTVNSLVYASAKTKNGLAAASIKTWNGLA
jgi:hypothetical protein